MPSPAELVSPQPGQMATIRANVRAKLGQAAPAVTVAAWEDSLKNARVVAINKKTMRRAAAPAPACCAAGRASAPARLMIPPQQQLLSLAAHA